jgi:hypothetical protein
VLERRADAMDEKYRRLVHGARLTEESSP